MRDLTGQYHAVSTWSINKNKSDWLNVTNCLIGQMVKEIWLVRWYKRSDWSDGTTDLTGQYHAVSTWSINKNKSDWLDDTRDLIGQMALVIWLVRWYKGSDWLVQIIWLVYSNKDIHWSHLFQLCMYFGQSASVTTTIWLVKWHKGSDWLIVTSKLISDKQTSSACSTGNWHL